MIESAYLAGLFDGEGTAFIHKHIDKRHGSIYFEARVKISNTDKQSLQTIREKLGFGTIQVEGNGRKGQRESYRLSINKKKDMEQFLTMVKPFVIMKKKEVDEVLVFLLKD